MSFILNFIFSIIKFIIRSFFTLIELWDCALIMFIVYQVLTNKTAIHPAIAFVLALAAALVFLWLLITKVGFVIVTVLFSTIWGGFFSLLIADMRGLDTTWTWVLFGLIFTLSAFLHKNCIFRKGAFGQLDDDPTDPSYPRYDPDPNDPENKRIMDDIHAKAKLLWEMSEREHAAKGR